MSLPLLNYGFNFFCNKPEYKIYVFNKMYVFDKWISPQKRQQWWINHSFISTLHNFNIIVSSIASVLSVLCVCLCVREWQGAFLCKLFICVYTPLIPLTDLRAHSKCGHFCLRRHYPDGEKGWMQRLKRSEKWMGLTQEKIREKVLKKVLKMECDPMQNWRLSFEQYSWVYMKSRGLGPSRACSSHSHTLTPTRSLTLPSQSGKWVIKM